MDVRRGPDGPFHDEDAPSRDDLRDELLWSLGLLGVVIALVVALSLLFGA